MRFTRHAALPAALVMGVLTACGGGSSGEGPPTGQPEPNPGRLAFSASTFAADESSATVAISVTRTGGSDGQVTVEFTAADGSASSGSDFAAVTETLTFADGDDTDRTVEIQLTDDDIDEPDETIQLSLSNITGGAVLGTPSMAEVVISDDEPDEFKLWVSVTGLRGSGLVLRNGDGGDLAIPSDGKFLFDEPLFSNDPYDVAVSVKPWGPAQTCSILNGTGTVIDTDIDDVVISCEDAVLQSLIVSRPVMTGSSPAFDLYILREDGEGLTQLTNTADADERVVGVYGDYVIFERKEQTTAIASLHSVRRDGTGEFPLSQHPEPDFAGITSGGIVVYNSDGNIYSADVTGIGPHSDLLVAATEDAASHVAADGRIVFTRTVGSQTDLGAIDIDGGNVTPLATGPNRETLSNVTPAGRAIYISQLVGDDRRDLYSVSLDGSGTTAISEEPDADQQVVRALETGVLIVHLSYNNGEEELRAIRDDGSTSRRLVAHLGRLTFAATAPGERVIYGIAAGTGGSHDIYIVGQDGFGNRPLAASDDNEYLAGLTADGAAVIERQTNSQIDLVRVELDGSREVPIALSPVNDKLVAVGEDREENRLILLRGAPSALRAGGVSGAGISLVSVRADGTDERLLAEGAFPALVEKPDELSRRAAGVVTRFGSVFFHNVDGRLWRVGADSSAAMQLTPFDDPIDIERLLDD